MRWPILAYLLIVLSACMASTAGPSSPAQESLTQLVAKLERSEIGKVEIVYLPAEIMTGNEVTPKALEDGFTAKVTIRDVRLSTHLNPMIQVLKSQSVQPIGAIPDVRWGIICFDLTGQRIGAVYVAGYQNVGSINDLPVSFNSSLRDWLNGSFRSVLR